jgi:hypothetical protein
MNKKSFWVLAISLAIFKLLVHLCTGSNYELHRDEMLYFSMGSHLSWGFASTPPFISFLAFIVKSIFGYHEFAVKLFPALFGALIVILIALFIKEIGGSKSGIFFGCFAYIVSTAMLRSSSLFMPVIFELFFWTLFLYFVLKLINRQDTRYWIWIGISFGLAFLNKYSILVLGFSTLLAILISENRKLLFSKYLIFGSLLGLLIILPNLIWQIQHNLAVVIHMRELYKTQLVHVSVLTFILEQIMMNYPALLIWLAGLIMLLSVKAERKYKVFAHIFLFVLLLFLILKGKPYYSLGVYVMMFAFGGYCMEKYLTGSRKWIKHTLIIFAIVSAVITLPFGLPVLPQKQMEKFCTFFSTYITSEPMRGEANIFYPLPQDYMDMTGWKETADLVFQAYNKLDDIQKKSCVIFANNYGQASAIEFYGEQYHLPPVVCLNDSYIFWAPDSLTASNTIVTDHQLGDIPVLFNNYTETGEINNAYFRENGLKVYLCKSPTAIWNKFFKDRIKEHKAMYRQ